MLQQVQFLLGDSQAHCTKGDEGGDKESFSVLGLNKDKLQNRTGSQASYLKTNLFEMSELYILSAWVLGVKRMGGFGPKLGSSKIRGVRDYSCLNFFKRFSIRIR